MSKGQGLIETIVALAIIIIGLIGALSLVVVSLSSAKQSEQKLIALNLAREGIEVIKNKRDSNWLIGEKWDKDFSLGLDYTAIIKFDSNTREWSLDFSPNDISDPFCKLYLDQNNLYLHQSSGNKETKFSRLISFQPLGEDAKRITSSVQWKRGKKIFSLKLEEVIYNWK